VEAGREISAYFERIGYQGPRAPTPSVLAALHWQHASTIPFENLDVLLGRGISLDPAAIAAKLVSAKRGGYCFEQNSLFADVLRALGFEVTALAARVWWGAGDAGLPPRTHMALRVDLAEGPVLCDVGFGGLTPVMPLPWHMENAQPTTHETYRLTVLAEGAAAGEIALQAEIGGAWQSLYSFLPQPVDVADFVIANWYVSTHPASLFTQEMICAMPSADGRHVLQQRRSTERRAGRRERNRQLQGPDHLATLLAETFGISLPPAEIDRLWARLPGP
jgi:N-hydroxyarylamine O-acetyltransferase